jgi:hypothetical protein
MRKIFDKTSLQLFPDNKFGTNENGLKTGFDAFIKGIQQQFARIRSCQWRPRRYRCDGKDVEYKGVKNKYLYVRMRNIREMEDKAKKGYIGIETKVFGGGNINTVCFLSYRE